MPNSSLRLAVGATTGAVGLIAMIRLVSGAFSDGMARFAWMAILLAMLPWIGYCAWRAWRAWRASRRTPGRRRIRPSSARRSRSRPRGSAIAVFLLLQFIDPHVLVRLGLASNDDVDGRLGRGRARSSDSGAADDD